MAIKSTDLTVAEREASQRFSDATNRIQEIQDQIDAIPGKDTESGKAITAELMDQQNQQILALQQATSDLERFAKDDAVEIAKEETEKKQTTALSEEARPKTTTKQTGKKTTTEKSARKRQLEKLLDERRKNLNVIGFNVSVFIDRIRKDIDSKRVNRVVVKSGAGESFAEPRLNTFYRMMGFPPTNISATTVDNEGVTVVAEIFDRESREDTVTGILDRGIPGTEDRILFPVTDEKIFIPFGQRVRFPFINSVIQIRINRFDFTTKDVVDAVKTKELETIIGRNIDGLIEAFPPLLLKKIQKLAKLDTESNRDAQVGDTDDTLNTQKPNKSKSDLKREARAASIFLSLALKEKVPTILNVIPFLVETVLPSGIVISASPKNSDTVNNILVVDLIALNLVSPILVAKSSSLEAIVLSKLCARDIDRAVSYKDSN